jgi:DmsE family decaheme c-type cytochrome
VPNTPKLTAKPLKLLVVCAFVLGAAALAFGDPVASAIAANAARTAAAADGEFVGAGRCAACHSDKYEQFATTPHHKLVTDPHTKESDKGCEACHGPGGEHVKLASDPATAAKAAGAIFNPRLATGEEVAARCTRCHTEQSLQRAPYHVEHDFKAASCNDCHSPHQEKTNSYMLIADPPNLCITCHAEVGSDFRKPYHHRVLEGSISCLDCHNAHGRNNTEEARLSASGLSALCVRCHTDKQGPFVFEHLAISRSEQGCLECHNSHGSANNRMLNRATVFQVCVQCHSQIGLSADPEVGASNAHDLSDPRFQNCTVCHIQVHGSNSSRVFLN